MLACGEEGQEDREEGEGEGGAWLSSADGQRFIVQNLQASDSGEEDGAWVKKENKGGFFFFFAMQE